MNKTSLHLRLILGSNIFFLRTQQKRTFFILMQIYIALGVYTLTQNTIQNGRLMPRNHFVLRYKCSVNVHTRNDYFIAYFR